MGTIEVVQQLPDLRTNHLPKFPPIPKGYTLKKYQIDEKNPERQIVAAAIISACSDADKWGPVSFPNLPRFFRQYQLMLTKPDRVIQAFWDMVEDKTIHVVQLRQSLGPESQFVVPTNKMCMLFPEYFAHPESR